MEEEEDDGRLGVQPATICERAGRHSVSRERRGEDETGDTDIGREEGKPDIGCLQEVNSWTRRQRQEESTKEGTATRMAVSDEPAAATDSTRARTQERRPNARMGGEGEPGTSDC